MALSVTFARLVADLVRRAVHVPHLCLLLLLLLDWGRAKQAFTPLDATADLLEPAGGEPKPFFALSERRGCGLAVLLQPLDEE